MTNLVDFILYSFTTIREYLGITSEILLSSEIKKNNELRGQDKILDICQLLCADEYINAIGGQMLYSYDSFLNKGIKLSFLKTNEIIYPQYGNVFQANLSILDVLMFNKDSDVRAMLKKYTIL